MRRASNRETTSAADNARQSHDDEPSSRRGERRQHGSKLALALVAVVVAILLAATTAVLIKRGRVFTAEELMAFDGTSKSRIYLAVLGEVYDVTRGKKHYGKGGPYSAFAGRDASLAFVTGKFVSDRTDDVSSLTPEQLTSLFEWQDFYNKDYRWVGKLQGRYYDAKGWPTAELAVLKIKAGRDQPRPEKAKPAPVSTACKKTSGMLSCPEGRYPRQVFQGASGVTCECFQSTMYSDQRRLYPGCKAVASECPV